MTALLLQLLLSAAPGFAAEAAASTGTAKAFTVADLYGAQGLRDPFQIVGAGGGGGGKSAGVYNPEEFSIHSLDLKGVMRDKGGAYAVLVDVQSGVGFILRNGALYDYRNKRVPNVKGIVRPAQKLVVLETADKDVQELRLGESEDDIKSKAAQ